MLIKPSSSPDNNNEIEQMELNECSFHKWYKNFEKISIPSKYIKIPSTVIEYLRDEIIILPKECYPNENSPTTSNSSSTTTITTTTNFSSSNYYEDEDTAEIDVPEFPEFSENIMEIIRMTSDSVAFIKNNWHSPKDAQWITVGQTLKVKDITDVYQLLKASSIIQNDLNNKNINGIDYYLVLKEWQEIHPGTEFRCFVKKRNLIAISPRDWPQFHKHILSQKCDIINDILSLFREKIKFKFPLENFVFDVVRPSKDQVILLDFSPFNEKFSDALAFEWNELKDDCENFNQGQIIANDGGEDDDDDEDNNLEFRYLTEDCGIQPNHRNNYGIPQDIIDIFNNSNRDTTTNNLDVLYELLANSVQEELRLPNNEVSDDDRDEDGNADGEE